MNQFTVPQFIDVEDKIIGPVTTRQFLIILVCFILIFIYYRIFDMSLFITASAFNIIVFSTFAFVKVNGRPFHFFVLNIIQTLKKTKLRIWNHILYKTGQEIYFENLSVIKDEKKGPVKIFTKSRLAELSLIVDTQGEYKGEKEDKIDENL